MMATPDAALGRQTDQEANQVRIDIVSDVVCPWCIIGFKQLERAIEQVGDSVRVDLQWHPFELNPRMPPEGQNLREHLARKYGTTLEQSIAARARLTALGEELGFAFRYFDEMRMHNTFHAHQLLHWAEGSGKQTGLKLALFDSYFTRREDVSDPRVLASAAKRAGLDPHEAMAVIDGGEFAAAVREREQFWMDRGINGVPAFIFNQHSLIFGAHSIDAFADTLARASGEKAAQ